MWGVIGRLAPWLRCQDVAALKDYMYAHLDREIVIVDAMDKKVVGPGYKEVAAKYAGQKDAEAALAKSIKAGGSGKWGPVPMPAQAALSDADARALAAWVLGGAK